eukprot:4913409-Amphidinium_carterae.1
MPWRPKRATYETQSTHAMSATCVSGCIVLPGIALVDHMKRTLNARQPWLGIHNYLGTATETTSYPKSKGTR